MSGILEQRHVLRLLLLGLPVGDGLHDESEERESGDQTQIDVPLPRNAEKRLPDKEGCAASEGTAERTGSSTLR